MFIRVGWNGKKKKESATHSDILHHRMTRIISQNLYLYTQLIV